MKRSCGRHLIRSALRVPLVPGTKLGAYEIVSPLGEGGMGEVYRARDTRLDRTVAIKILSVQFACDPICRQRFEREARAIPESPNKDNGQFSGAPRSRHLGQ